MTDSNIQKVGLWRLHVRSMVARSREEAHRASTPLELLFDLVTVIAVATAVAGLHHAIIEHHLASGLLAFAMAFFSIWWAWMHFTWFASGYDNDDLIYRFLVFIMLAGSLCLAAGVNLMFEGHDFSLGVAGYVIMRLSHVVLLWRASNHNPDLRGSTRALAVGIALCQMAWIAGNFLVPKGVQPYFFFAMVAIELSIPALVSYAGEIPWHNEHIAERYGLLTIIVLGESLLSLSWNIEKLVDAHVDHWAIGVNIITGLVSMFAMWWLYFGEKNFKAHERMATTYQWGYGHVIIFAAIATFGGGLAVNMDFITGKAEISQLVTSGALAIPAAAFLLGVWFVHERFNSPGSMMHLVFLGYAALALVSMYVAYSSVIISILLVIAAITKSWIYSQTSGEKTLGS